MMKTTRPANAVVHIPDAWRTAGVQRSPANRFEFETLYTDGARTLSESELLAQNVACYRVQIDRYTVRDFPANIS
jgi:hypothetical protein